MLERPLHLRFLFSGQHDLVIWRERTLENRNELRNTQMEHEYFKKVAVIHGVFSLALLALFGVGFHHTQNTDWDGSAPYWVFGVITGIMVK